MQKIIHTGTLQHRIKTWSFNNMLRHKKPCSKIDADSIICTYNNDDATGLIPKSQIDNWDELEDTIELSIDNMLVS